MAPLVEGLIVQVASRVPVLTTVEEGRVKLILIIHFNVIFTFYCVSLVYVTSINA